MPSRRFVLLSLALLAGCGFAPVYAPGGAAAGLRGQVAVDPPTDRYGYLLVRRLEERLGLPEAPRYRLAADIRIDRDSLGITPREVTTRYALRGAVGWRLIDAATGALLREGREESFVGYSATSTTVATIAAEEDARERLMTILADRIVSDLLASAHRWR